MKIFFAALAASSILAGTAYAADPDAPVLDETPRTFLTIKGGYGPSLIDNDFTTFNPAGGLSATGEFDDDYIAGFGAEAGMFLTENIRVSVQANLGRIEHEFEVLAPVGVAIPLSGHTKVYQGFLKTAYETRLSDIGFTAPIFERSSIFATAGVGFTHLRSKADLLTPGGAFDADEEDTVFSGVVGLGSVYALTDRIDFISEVNYTFGGDADLGFTIPGTGTFKTVTETRALTSQIGLRFKF